MKHSTVATVDKSSSREQSVSAGESRGSEAGAASAASGSLAAEEFPPRNCLCKHYKTFFSDFVGPVFVGNFGNKAGGLVDGDKSRSK